MFLHKVEIMFLIRANRGNAHLVFTSQKSTSYFHCSNNLLIKLELSPSFCATLCSHNSISCDPLSFLPSTFFSFQSSHILFSLPFYPSMFSSLILISLRLCSKLLYFPPPSPPPLGSTCLPDFLDGAQKDAGSLCRALYGGRRQERREGSEKRMRER